MLRRPRLFNEVHIAIRDLITFGGPRVGNREFAKTLKLSSEHRGAWRFVNGNDIVPLVPKFDYADSPEPFYHPDVEVNIYKYGIYRGETEIGTDPPRSYVGTVAQGLWRSLYWYLTQHTGTLIVRIQRIVRGQCHQSLRSVNSPAQEMQRCFQIS